MTKYWPIFLTGILSAGAVLYGHSLGSDPFDSWVLAARYSARLAFLLFTLAFVTSSLATLWPSALTRGLMKQRRYWGLSFALAHTFHAYAVIQRLRVQDGALDYLDIGQGSVAYLIIYALAFTSNGAAQRAMGKKWNIMHLFGTHIIWMVFTAAYAERLIGDEQRVLGAIMVVIALGSFGLRIASSRKQSAALKAKRAEKG